MNNRNLYALIGIVALVIIGLLIYNQSRQDNALESANKSMTTNESATNFNTNNTEDVNVISPANTNTQTNENTNTNGQFSDESDLDQGQVYEVTFNGTAYAPATLNIKAGDTVVFKNNSDKSFWPASAPHPQHTNYPEFDAKKSIAPGQSFQFKFIKVGSWGFHDHLTPTAFGKINVTE